MEIKVGERETDTDFWKQLHSFKSNFFQTLQTYIERNTQNVITQIIYLWLYSHNYLVFCSHLNKAESMKTIETMKALFFRYQNRTTIKSQEEHYLLEQVIGCLLKVESTVLTLHAIWWNSCSSHSRDRLEMFTLIQVLPFYMSQLNTTVN